MDPKQTTYDYGSYKVEVIEGLHIRFIKRQYLHSEDMYPSGYLLLIFASVLIGVLVFSKPTSPLSERAGFLLFCFPFGILLPIAFWANHKRYFTEGCIPFQIEPNSLSLKDSDENDISETIIRTSLYRRNKSKLKIVTESQVFITSSFGTKKNAKKILTLVRSLAPNEIPME